MIGYTELDDRGYIKKLVQQLILIVEYCDELMAKQERPEKDLSSDPALVSIRGKWLKAQKEIEFRLPPLQEIMLGKDGQMEVRDYLETGMSTLASGLREVSTYAKHKKPFGFTIQQRAAWSLLEEKVSELGAGLRPRHKAYVLKKTGLRTLDFRPEMYQHV